MQVGLSTIIRFLFGGNLATSVFIAGIVTMIYTGAGGLLSVAYTGRSVGRSVGQRVTVSLFKSSDAVTIFTVGYEYAVRGLISDLARLSGTTASVGRCQLVRISNPTRV